jgi:hypothetical protein
MNYKNHGISALRKYACHEHLHLYRKWGFFLLQRVIETQSEKKRGKSPPFLNHRLFWQPMALPQIKSFTTSYFGGLGFLCCKGLLTFIFC